MVEPTDPDHAALSWLQLQDSALPSGRFVHSYGLEAWLEAFPDAGEAEIATLARRFVAGSVATLDAVVLAHTASAGHADLVRLDRLLLSYKTTASSRRASQTGGRRLARLAIDAFDGLDGSRYLVGVAANAVPGNLAVVEGHVHVALGVPVRSAVLGHLRAAYAGFLSAGVRLGRLGPVAVQRLVHRRRGELADLAGLALTRGLDDLTSSVPELDLYAMTHETRTERLFAT